MREFGLNMDVGGNLRFVSHSAEQTADLGCGLGRVLKPGDIICLEMCIRDRVVLVPTGSFQPAREAGIWIY